MDQQTTGIVTAASRQWWLKFNTKPVRGLGTDGALFPYIIKATYSVNGQEYVKRKWIHAGETVPKVGSKVRIAYAADKPSKAKIL